MYLKTYISKNTFRDSVYLMRLSGTVREFEGVVEAEVIIGTDHNKKFLKSGGLWTEEIAKEAGANDLVIAVKAEDEAQAEAAIQGALDELNRSVERENLLGEFVPRTFETALKNLPGSNLALLSIPGRYVRREAERIIEAGLHLMIFSDNVTLEDEIFLKKAAREKNLLVMGPDCGTALIGGVPLAFANEVNRGRIGIVAAAGTGLQEVSTLVSNLGEGVSHGIGTGGRDVKKAVGGISMLIGLEALTMDEDTEVIVVVSKPPDPEVGEKVLRAAAGGKKPVVVCFLGGSPGQVTAAGCLPAANLKEAALLAVALARGEDPASAKGLTAVDHTLVHREKKAFGVGQRYLRALYSGGTLAYETLTMITGKSGRVFTNLSYDGAEGLDDVYLSREHTVIDFGEDEFTQGRLHPMIDPALRNSRIIAEAEDPGTAVIMLDLVLGYNAHPDPAGSALEAIAEARRRAAAAGRRLTFVVSVCGTDQDPQKRSEQVAKLEKAGVLVFPGNADAAAFVGALLF